MVEGSDFFSSFNKYKKIFLFVSLLEEGLREVTILFFSIN
jgi:hypothetical protein